MKRIAIFTGVLVLTAAPALAEDLLGGIFGEVQTEAKATAFDTAVESQAPGAAVLTDQLSSQQKAQLFDYGVDNADTLGQAGSVMGGSGGSLSAGAAALGAATVTGGGGQQQPVYGQQPVPYGQQQIYGQAVATDAYGNALTTAPQATYEQQTIVQPAYGQAVDVYSNALPTPPQPTVAAQTVYGQPAVTNYVQPATIPSYGATQQAIPAPSYNPPSQIGAGTQAQSGLSYDPNSGQVTVGADAIQSIGGLISN